MKTPNLPSLAVTCPACGSTAGEPCTSHSGTRVRTHNVHLARKVAWEEMRIAAVPAAKLIADAAHNRTIISGTRAAALLAEHGYAAEADRIQNEVKARNGLMSAKQAVAFLVDGAEVGEG